MREGDGYRDHLGHSSSGDEGGTFEGLSLGPVRLNEISCVCSRVLYEFFVDRSYFH